MPNSRIGKQPNRDNATQPEQNVDEPHYDDRSVDILPDEEVVELVVAHRISAVVETLRPDVAGVGQLVGTRRTLLGTESETQCRVLDRLRHGHRFPGVTVHLSVASCALKMRGAPNRREVVVIVGRPVHRRGDRPRHEPEKHTEDAQGGHDDAANGWSVVRDLKTVAHWGSPPCRPSSMMKGSCVFRLSSGGNCM